MLSGDLTSDSRILYVRNPRERVEKVAPYLTIDGDPYPAVINGRVTWILDGYTTSNGYPYSERADLRDVTSDALVSTRSNRVAQASSQFNYIRNSVKATVDAYDGTVTLYAFDPQDPVLQTWMKIFPGTVKPLGDLQANQQLMAHLRYPEDIFKAQRTILARYHVTDAGVFYTQEDSWQVPEDPTQPGRAPQPPHYQFGQLPMQSSSQFNLTSALVANRRPNMSAYMYVSSDPGPDYGKIHVLTLPKQVSILGPVQVQNQIESNPAVSRDLSLLRSGGSSVDTGNLLTLPVGAGLLYVEPIYVEASGGTGYPTLRRVAMVFGDQVGYGTFERGFDAGVRAEPDALAVPVARPQPLARADAEPADASPRRGSTEGVHRCADGAEEPERSGLGRLRRGTGPAADRAQPAGQHFGAGDGQPVAFGLARRPRRPPRHQRARRRRAPCRPARRASAPAAADASGRRCGHALSRAAAPAAASAASGSAASGGRSGAGAAHSSAGRALPP